MKLMDFFKSSTEKMVDLGQAALGKVGNAKPFWYKEGDPLVRIKGTTLEVARIKQDAPEALQANLRRQVYLGAETILERNDTTIDSVPDEQVRGIARVLDTGRLRNVLTDKYVGDRLLFATEAGDAIEDLKEAHPAQAITNMLAMNRSLSLDNTSAMSLAQLVAERDDVRDVWGKMEKEGILQDALDMRTKQDAVNLAEKLLQFFKDNNMEPPPPTSGDGSGEGEGGKGSGQEGESKGKGEGDGEGKPGDEANFGAQGMSFANIEQVLKNNLTDPGDVHGLVAESDYDPPEIEFWDRAKGTRGRNTSGISRLVNANDRIGHELTRILQVRSAARYEHLQTRGKISPSHLYRVALPTLGSGTWNSQVFRKKKVSDCLDTAVCLLVDCSGSMSGNKYEAASASAVLMGNALDVVHVPFEILGFTDNYSTAVIPVFKQFSMPWSPEDVIGGFGDQSHHLSGNPDAVAVDVATARLLQRKNKRKVLIVLSDGMPSSFLADGAGALKKAVKSAEKQGVEVFGIGIDSTAVKSFYDQHVVVKDYSRLSQHLLDVLDKKLS